jgi:hypothetical protein
MGMLIDMPIATQAIDSSGEVLKIDGVDITDFIEGKAKANWEHQNGSADDIVGIFRYAKKIHSEKDCSTDRQKDFWKQIKLPFIYGICELYDDADHPGAVAIAAMIRFYKNKKEKIQVGASIEGSTMERKGNVLERATARKVAITLAPCNKQCWVDVIDEKDLKSVMKKHDNFNAFKFDADSIEISADLLPENPFEAVQTALADLQKTLTAGNYNVAPSQLVGGAALAREQLDGTTKNRLKALVRDWNKQRPLREVIKAAMPEVADKYLDHFADVAQDIALKKSNSTMHRISANEHGIGNLDQDQKDLLDGIYMNKAKEMHVPHDNWSNAIYHAQNDKGQKVVLKHVDKINDIVPLTKRSGQYHRLAKDFFGLGNHVPVTAHFTGHDGEEWVAQEHKDGKTPFESAQLKQNAAKQGKLLGHTQKLYLMDHILGQDDRHDSNILIHPKTNEYYHIDNDRSFRYMPHNTIGEGHHQDNLQGEPVQQETKTWLKSLDAKALAKQMMDHGMDMTDIKHAAKRLKSWQKFAPKSNNIIETSNKINGIE